MEDLLILIGKTYGLVGLLIVAPFFGLFVVWTEYKKHIRETAATLAAANIRSEEAQKQRVADAQSITTRLMEMVEEQSSLNKETNLTLNRIGEMLSNRHDARR